MTLKGFALGRNRPELANSPRQLVATIEKPFAARELGLLVALPFVVLCQVARQLALARLDRRPQLFDKGIDARQICFKLWRKQQ